MGSIHYRRVVKIGVSYCIFLPIQWIRYNELEEGDKLKITDKENDLQIEITDETYPNFDMKNRESKLRIH